MTSERVSCFWMVNVSGAHGIVAWRTNTSNNFLSLQNCPTSVKLIDGFQLWGTPVGTLTFARVYYKNQLDTITKGMQLLNSHITNKQTSLKLFAKCTIQKVPHLLALDTMQNINTTESVHNRYNWNRDLISGTDNIIQEFFKTLLQWEENQPNYVTTSVQIMVVWESLMQAFERY